MSHCIQWDFKESVDRIIDWTRTIYAATAMIHLRTGCKQRFSLPRATSAFVTLAMVANVTTVISMWLPPPFPLGKQGERRQPRLQWTLLCCFWGAWKTPLVHFGTTGSSTQDWWTPCPGDGRALLPVTPKFDPSEVVQKYPLQTGKWCMSPLELEELPTTLRLPSLFPSPLSTRERGISEWQGAPCASFYFWGEMC